MSDKEWRCYLRGLTPLGIFNTIIGCLFNIILARHTDMDTGEFVKWSWETATDFPPAEEEA